MSQPQPPIDAETLDQAGTLDEAQQQELIQQIGRVIMHSLPPGWDAASVEYRAIGSHNELVAQLSAPNGTLIPIELPAHVAPMFDQLRSGMYQPERGTWISALYHLSRPGSYSVDFNGDYEPSWNTVPSSELFADELRRYPRSEANVPAWLTQRATPADTPPQ